MKQISAKYIVNEPNTILKYLLSNVKNKSKNNIKSLLTNECVFVNDKLVTKYDYSLNPIKLSFHEKKIISLMIMYILIKNFEDNECEITTEYVAKKLEISINLTQNLIDNLIKIGLINKISVDNKPFFYKPSTSIEKMDIDFITNKLEFFGINNLLDLEENKLKIIYENLNNLIIHNKNTKLKDL